jgi:hypothetical protein
MFGYCCWLLPLLLLRPCSPLHYAAWGNHAHIIRKLLGATTVSDRLLLQGCTDNYDRCGVSTSVQVQAQADTLPPAGCDAHMRFAQLRQMAANICLY